MGQLVTEQVVRGSVKGGARMSLSYGERVETLRKTFLEGRTHKLEWRSEQLKGVLRFLKEQEDAIFQATSDDLGRTWLDNATEVFCAITECKNALKHLKSWTAPRKCDAGFENAPCTSNVSRVPFGVVLVIAPWNYPVVSALSPMIGAIAGGNCVVLKPSDLAPSSAALLEKSLTKYVDSEAIQVIQAGPEETGELLKVKFDNFFFTGSTRVGKLIYKAAAEHMAPCTLELGGKNPVIVDETTNFELCARRVLWAKLVNSGQVCISPDYVIVLSGAETKLYDAIRKVHSQFYPDGKAAPETCTKMINHKHADRLIEMLEEDEKIRGSILVGGEYDRNEKFIAPTVLQGTNPEAKVMDGEIFGPLLPIIAVDSLEEAIAFIRARPNPLACYMFSTNSYSIEKVRETVQTGCVFVNDLMWQYRGGNMPFGGVGDSGMGRGLGKSAFDAHTYEKVFFHKSSRDILDPGFRYPPMKPWKMKMWSSFMDVTLR